MTRSNDLGEHRKVATVGCTFCHGEGLVGMVVKVVPCPCSYQGIFKACYRTYRECRGLSGFETGIVRNGLVCSRPYEEYIADFEILIRRKFLTFFPAESGEKIWIDFRNDIRAGKKISPSSITELAGMALVLAHPHALFPVRQYWESGVLGYGSAFPRTHRKPSLDDYDMVIRKSKEVSTTKNSKFWQGGQWESKDRRPLRAPFAETPCDVSQGDPEETTTNDGCAGSQLKNEDTVA